MFCRHLHEHIKIVRRNGFVGMFKSTRYTFVEYCVLPTLFLYSNRLHESPTSFSSVSGGHVYMLGPQTLRAMIRIAITLYKKSTFLTSEVLDVTPKVCCHVTNISQLLLLILSGCRDSNSERLIPNQV